MSESHGHFVATCEKCGDGVALTAEQQTRYIGLRGEFRCGPCGGMRPATQLAPRKAPRAPRPSKPRAQSNQKPALTAKETRCCLKGEEPPTYFRPCPDCPLGLR